MRITFNHPPSETTANYLEIVESLQITRRKSSLSNSHFTSNSDDNDVSRSTTQESMTLKSDWIKLYQTKTLD